jgi:hypothetical protein
MPFALHVCKTIFSRANVFAYFTILSSTATKLCATHPPQNGCAHENTSVWPRVDDPVDRGSRCARNHHARCMRTRLWFVVCIGHVCKPERRYANPARSRCNGRDDNARTIDDCGCSDIYASIIHRKRHHSALWRGRGCQHGRQRERRRAKRPGKPHRRQRPGHAGHELRTRRQCASAGQQRREQRSR